MWECVLGLGVGVVGLVGGFWLPGVFRFLWGWYNTDSCRRFCGGLCLVVWFLLGWCCVGLCFCLLRVCLVFVSVAGGVLGMWIDDLWVCELVV